MWLNKAMKLCRREETEELLVACVCYHLIGLFKGVSSALDGFEIIYSSVGEGEANEAP